MKTAISLPDPLFRQAEAAARKMKVSRSELYAKAIEEFLRRRRDETIIAQINGICERLDTGLDPDMETASLDLLREERW